MTIKSLAGYEPTEQIDADVIIVGAGLAGLFLANSLSMSSLRILVLESGSESQLTETHHLNAIETVGEEYRGATHGRFRCLGGSSTRWGAALLPYLKEDLDKHPCGWHSGWGIKQNGLEISLPNIEAAFGVEPGTYEQFEAGSEELLPNFLPRSPKWPAFKKRNTARIFEQVLRKKSNITVWIDATVTKINLKDARISGVEAESINGNRLKASAPTVVLAAGAIETTRMLLLLNRAQNGRLFVTDSPLGRGFHDHLSAPIADFIDFDVRFMARMFGFQFVNGGMRNLRFELSPDTRAKFKLPAAFLHVAFTRDPESGFEGLRGIFQSLQQKQFPQAADYLRIISDLPWFARAVWWKFIENRVLPPSGSGYKLHLVTEQCPDYANRISLSKDNFDVFGFPQAKICWKISPSDFSNFHQLTGLAIKSWRSGTISQSTKLARWSQEKIDFALRSEGGIYHPAGTTRIGLNAKSSVVDNSLKVHGVNGLRVLSTSNFPSIGGSSPSLALLQLALKMSREILTEHNI